ncbi:MAG TPA: TraR/DksA family transcriptional regulator [Bacteroidia bacterium]|nr:TraR/DksA family transcriptional regulator [Bacteroidia bacterium]
MKKEKSETKKKPVIKVDDFNQIPLKDSNGNIRYSDKDLKEFKDLILTKLNQAKKDYELLKETISLKTENGTEDTSPIFKVMEGGGEASSKEESSQHAMRLQKYIEHLQNALIRIENKTYGICSITGDLISKERLRSVPHSTLSINAKLGITAK